MPACMCVDILLATASDHGTCLHARLHMHTFMYVYTGLLNIGSHHGRCDRVGVGRVSVVLSMDELHVLINYMYLHSWSIV